MSAFSVSHRLRKWLSLCSWDSNMKSETKMSLTDGFHVDNCSDRPVAAPLSLGVVAGVGALVEVVDCVQLQRVAPPLREQRPVLTRETGVRGSSPRELPFEALTHRTRREQPCAGTAQLCSEAVLASSSLK